MADNDEAGGSTAHHASEDELEKHYHLQFINSQGRHDDEGDDEYDPHADENLNRADTDTGDADTETGDAGTDRTSGSAAKHQQKNRRQNWVGTGRVEITEVDPASGEPLEPQEYAKGFGNTCAAIAREICSINDGYLRRKINLATETLLIQRVHARYKFLADYDNLDIKGNLVNEAALGKISKGLGSWRYRVRKMLLDQDMSFEEIRGHYPQISLADLATFKENEDTPEGRAKREWGKSMRDKNIGHHNLGTRGFLGKQPIWDKEDATRPPGVEFPGRSSRTRWHAE